MYDTLKRIAQNTQSTVQESIDLVEKVDNFYNNAWSKLILFGSVLFGVVGVFVPILIQWYQKRTLKLSEAELKDRLKKEITQELVNNISLKFSENEKQIKSLIASANAKILFSQAKFSLEKNAHKSALGELVAAAYSSIECDDFRMLQDILDYILKNCLLYLSLEEIIDLKTAGICDLNLFLDELSKKDDRAMFQEKIGNVKVSLSKLPKTIVEKPNEKPKSES